MTPENRNSTLLGNSGKQFPAKMNTNVAIEEPVSKQLIGKHNSRGIIGNCVFCSVRAKWL
jgi:hypothetical protein